jgi:Flp pilus assembly protein CpaB
VKKIIAVIIATVVLGAAAFALPGDLVVYIG